MKYLEELKTVIRRLHDCDAVYVTTVPVKEIFQGQTVWDGKVEVFDLTGHPQAKRCYAWSHVTDADGKRAVAVLELPPVTSPETAVKAAIVQEAKENAKRGS